MSAQYMKIILFSFFIFMSATGYVYARNEIISEPTSLIVGHAPQLEFSIKCINNPIDREDSSPCIPGNILTLDSFKPQDVDGDAAIMHRAVWFSKTQIEGWINGLLIGDSVYYTLLPEGDNDCQLGFALGGCMSASFIEENGLSVFDLPVTEDMVGHEIMLNSASVTECSTSEPCFSNLLVSNGITPQAGNNPPVVSRVSVNNGNPYIGDTLEGRYNYFDAELDQDVSSYQWYRNGIAINGATKKSYSVTLEDEGKKLSFGVTPISVQENSSPAQEVRSDDTAEVQRLTFTGVYVNEYEFSVNDGFPTTGFIGAEFILKTPQAASEYTWSSSEPWVSVDGNGKVSFISKGNSEQVVITAFPKDETPPLVYRFKIANWFTSSDKILDYDEAYDEQLFMRGCDWIGWRHPLMPLVSIGENNRGVGALYSEWGSMGYYSRSVFHNADYWTSMERPISVPFALNLETGFIYNNPMDVLGYALCYKSL